MFYRRRPLNVIHGSPRFASTERGTIPGCSLRHPIPSAVAVMTAATLPSFWAEDQELIAAPKMRTMKLY
jgi:hypothetical protein